jgi:PIN domain nuclease of toxin-antitoxin system
VSVVDASVVLAWLQDEAGADEAERHLVGGVIGAANWSEMLQKARQHGADAELVARLIVSFGLQVADTTRADGEQAAVLWRRGSGLSLADRLCLALGLRLAVTVVTTDAAWATVPGGPEVLVLRQMAGVTGRD